MDPRTVYTKAAKGVMELKNKGNRLPRDLFNVLKLIDGKSNVNQIFEKSDQLTEPQLHQALEKLVTDGFIKVFMSGVELGAMEELDFTISPIIGSHNKKKGKIPEKPKQEIATETDAKRKALATAKTEMTSKLKAAREMRAQVEVERKKTEIETKEKQEAEIKARADMAAKIKSDQQIEFRKNAIQNAMQIEEIEVTPLTQLSQLGVDLGTETIADTTATENLNAKLRAAMEVKAIAEAEKRRQEEESKTRAEAEAKARTEIADKVKAEFEAKQRAEAEAKVRREAEERTRREAEERVRREAAEKAKREAEERARREAEERARREAEERVRREAAEKAKREAEERARREAEERARREAEERVRREAAEKAKREAEERARQEAEARARAEAAERARREEQEKATREAEERARQEAETRLRAEAKSLAESEARIRQEEDARARAAAKAKATVNAEIEMKMKLESEEKTRQEADARARANTKTRAEMDAKTKADARTRAEAEAEVRVKARAEAEAKAAEDERKRIAAEARARAESEARSRAEIQARAKAEAWAEQDTRARVERDAARQTVEEEKIRLAALAKMKKKSVHWPKTIFLSLIVLVGVVVAFLQFAPFNIYIPRIEKLAAEKIGESVIIRSLHVSLIPIPHLKLEGITIGKSPEIKINAIRVMFEPLSLLNDVKVLQSIELEDLTLPEEVLPKIAAWGRPNKNQPFSINQIKLKNAKIESKNTQIPSFEGTLDLTSAGEFKRASIRTSDARVNALINAQGGQNFEIEFKANDWQPPLFKVPFMFEELSAKAIANKEGLTINELESKFYGGVVKGSATIKWNNTWQLDGMFNIARVDLKEMLSIFTQDISASGKMNAILTYNAQSEALNNLFDSPKVDASFNIQKGSISSLDLIQAMQSNRDLTRGGQTQFNDFSGNMVLSDETYQFKQLKLSSGLLNASGNVDISPDRELSGRITAQLRTKSTFVLSGNIKGPVLQRR